MNDVNRWIDGAEDEGTEEVDRLEALTGDVPHQRLDVNDDIRQLGQLIFLEPFHDLLARPMMIVVEVQDDGVERQPLVASLGTSATDVLQTVEQTLHPRTNGVRFVRIGRTELACRTACQGPSLISSLARATTAGGAA